MKNKLILLIGILFLANIMIVSETVDVEWLSGYTEAKKAAVEQNKNIFVLITAPSWCHWCKLLENNVLSKDQLKDTLNSDFIPLKLLDVVDGVRNPQLNFFEFRGFPTVRIYDPNGKFLENVYSQDLQETLKNLKKYANI
ncbi:MAG: thioredoxin family protein [Spirochaetaceae bacterium]